MKCKFPRETLREHMAGRDEERGIGREESVELPIQVNRWETKNSQNKLSPKL